MEIIIKFSYTGIIFWNEVIDLFDLIKSADFLGIDEIKEEGIKVLASDLDPLQSIDAYHLSFICNNVLLKRKSQGTIFENFEIISETREFLKLDIDALKDILSNDPVIRCTEKIFEGILRWLVEDLDRRKLCLMDIFELIQCGSVDLNMIAKIASNGKILTESPQHK